MDHILIVDVSGLQRQRVLVHRSAQRTLKCPPLKGVGLVWTQTNSYITAQVLPSFFFLFRAIGNKGKIAFNLRMDSG